MYLSEKYDFRFNEVLNRVEYRTKDEKSQNFFKILNDYQLNSIYVELQESYINISKGNLRSLLESRFSERYDPIFNYFIQLPEWDKERDYILELSNTVKVSNQEEFNWAFKKWIVAVVASATQRDVSNHTVLILTGKQGLGKSTWFQQMIPKSLKNYFFSGNIDPRDKDSVLQLSENLIINMDELASFDRKKIEQFKELITRPSSRVRRAYAQFSENYPRRASFVGSSNERNILTDVSGNRRFLVFEALKIDCGKLINIDAVYSQAFNLSRFGFQYWFDENDINRVEANNEFFYQPSKEEELIKKYFRPGPEKGEKPELMNATEVIEYINLHSKGKKHYDLNNVVLGKVLSKMGFKQKKTNGLLKYEMSIKPIVD